ncbi:MAG: 2-C-methyl-D-erythritol 4-phosphate cytidylyltransferase [Clostridiales bacterium]|nr:2-C-methyl-D-erythritol 4-phosphate cytidylyltransferase [Clostridiales bacterium]
MKTTAIVLAAGQGKRMKSSVQKQFLLIRDYPVLYYALKTFEESFVDEVILVTGENEREYCKKEIVEFYGFKKVTAIVSGGKERYHSVYAGLTEAAKRTPDYVFIHDGARPFLDQEMLMRAYDAVRECRACVVGMPVKDTIKLADEKGFAAQTPRRDLVWTVQTPQAFSFQLVYRAYGELIQKEETLSEQGVRITDDAMVVETFTDVPVKLVPGSYENIKITTPEDLKIAEAFLKESSKNKDSGR